MSLRLAFVRVSTKCYVIAGNLETAHALCVEIACDVAYVIRGLCLLSADHLVGVEGRWLARVALTSVVSHGRDVVLVQSPLS